MPHLSQNVRPIDGWHKMRCSVIRIKYFAELDYIRRFFLNPYSQRVFLTFIGNKIQLKFQWIIPAIINIIVCRTLFRSYTNELRFASFKTQNASCSGVAIMYNGAVTRHRMCAVWRTVLTLSTCNVHYANSYSCSSILCKVCSCIPQVWKII
jgi:hypothetical protein